MTTYNLIGSGSYGYVFHPPINYHVRDNHKYVGKVVDYDSEDNICKYVESEIRHYEVLRRIDPNFSFLIYPILTSQLLIKDIKTSTKHSLKFLKTKPKNSKIVQMIMPYGGVSLNSYLHSCGKSGLSFRRALSIVYDLLLGVALLQQNNICHQDIKLNNITYDPITGNARIIDFGMAVTKDEFYTSNWMFQSHKYAVNPPEYRLLNIPNLIKYTVYMLGKNELNTLHDFCCQFYAVERHVYDLFNIGTPKYLQHLKRLQKDFVDCPDCAECAETTQVLTILKSFHSFEKSDAYSIGIIMMQLYPLCKPTTDKHISDTFQTIGTSLLCPHPQERMGIPEALLCVKNLIKYTKTNSKNQDATVTPYKNYAVKDIGCLTI